MTTSLPSLKFLETGDPASQSIVFLHGGGVGAWMWLPVISRLAGFHCLAPDLPEHGGSREVGPFSMPLAAAKVADLVRENTRQGRAVVVGLSEGAQVTVELLSRFPDRVEKAVVSSALLVDIPWMSWAMSPFLLKWAYRSSIPPFRNQDWWIRLNMKYAAGIPDAFFPEYKKDFQETTESGFVNLVLANQDYRLPAGLERVCVPVLALAGRREYMAMKRSAQLLARALPNGSASLINLGKGASLAKEHNWALTAPDQFAATLRAWVANQPLPECIQRITG